MVGENHPLAKRSKYKVLNYGTFFYKDSEDTMGWSIRESGFKLLLNKNVSSIVKENIPRNVNDLLKESEINMDDIKFSISHPGGPKVLIAMEEALNLRPEDFANSWESLKEHGNLSSVSVLNVLERSLNSSLGKEGDVGIMAAMGPGFNSEITLIKAIK
jgi:alkylresorcinol/alkylpyrone synthase